MNLPPVSAAVSSPISAPTVTPPLPDAARRPVGEAANTPNRTERPAEDRAADKAQSAAPSRDALESAAKAVQDFVKPMSDNLEFTLDEDTGRTVIKVTDSATKELIRQIPSEEMLEIAKALDRLQGLLVRQKA